MRLPIQGRDGIVRFDCQDEQEVVSALKEIFNTTEIGKTYKKEFYVKDRGDDDFEKLVRAAIQIAGSDMISIGDLSHALTLLIDSGEIKPKNFTATQPLEEPVEDTRPRDRNGKLLTDAQIAWGEMARFAETASADAIRQRKNVDGKFREFVANNLRREMQGEIGDAVIPAGQPTAKTRANQTLVDFARKYNAEPSQNLKPRGGFILLAGEQVPYSQFLELVNAATNARLL